MNPMNPSELSNALVQWIPLLPVWFVFLAGTIVACIFWPACPRSSLLTLLALVLLGAVTAVGPAINPRLMQAQQAHGWTAAQLGFYFMGVGAILNLVRAVGYGLLLAAVFTGRRPPQLPPAGTVQPPPLVPPPAL